MFDQNQSDSYSASRLPFVYLLVVGVAGLSIFFGNEQLASLIEPLKTHFSESWKIILGLTSVALISIGMTRRVYTLRSNGPILTSLNLLWLFPISREEYPRAYLRHIDISFESTVDRGSSSRGYRRSEYYVLKLVFEDFKRIEIMRSPRREKVVKEAEAIQAITGARLG